MKKSPILTALFVAFLICPAVLRAQEVNTDPIIQPGDSNVETDDPTLMGDSTADGGDVANVDNPGQTTQGMIQVKVDADGYAELHRSGALVARTELILLEDGVCKEALGPLGRIRICGDDITVSLTGRPDFKCPAGTGGVSEACAVPAS